MSRCKKKEKKPTARVFEGVLIQPKPTTVEPIVFIVITKVPSSTETGNLYDDLLYLVTDDDGDKVLSEPEPEDREHEPVAADAVRVRLRNFTLGEILICDEDGRELGGRGRKPSKWYVEHERFTSVSEAVARARAVREAP